MSTHTAEVRWERHASPFIDNRYSRAHEWRFDGGAVVPASSSPHVVRLPFSDPSCVDPEEAFIAALSSCHMLWFLGLAAKHGYVVDSYVDTALGAMQKNADGREAVTTVTLQPAIVFSGTKAPTAADVDALHHQAHDSCFLANSVKTEIAIAGTWTYSNSGSVPTFGHLSECRN